MAITIDKHADTNNEIARLGELIRGERAEPVQAPCPVRAKGLERGCGIKPGVIGRPGILIESLNRVMGLRNHLAPPIGKRQLAIGQMANYRVQGPLARSIALIHAPGA